MGSVAPSINAAVTDKDAFDPFSTEKGTDGSIAEKGAQKEVNSIVPPVDEAEISQSPSKILDYHSQHRMCTYQPMEMVIIMILERDEYIAIEIKFV